MPELEVLTHTKRSMFMSCRRKFWWRFEQGLELRMQSPGRRKGHAFGTAIWAALEARDEDPLTVNAAVLESLEQAYSTVYPSSQADADDVDFEQHALECLVLRYLEQYPLKARREIQFDLPLMNPKTNRSSRTFRRAGKIDGVEHVGAQKARLIEDKLTSQISQVMIDRLPLDAQTSEYVDAFLTKGWSVEVEFRYTRWPSIRVRKNETVEQFKERFTEDLADRPEFYFIKQEVIYPTDHIARFRRDRWQVGQDIVLARRVGESAFYLNTSACFEYGGCPYIPLCTNQLGAEDLYVVTEDTPELERSTA